MNIKSDETIHRFIELRAQGPELRPHCRGTERPQNHLIALSRKHADRIHNLRALEAEALAEECGLSRQALVETLADDMQRVRAEIARRPLNSIPAAACSQ